MLDRHAMREIARLDVLGGAIEIGDGPDDPASKDKSSHEKRPASISRKTTPAKMKPKQVEEAQLTEGSENPAV